MAIRENAPFKRGACHLINTESEGQGVGGVGLEGWGVGRTDTMGQGTQDDVGEVIRASSAREGSLVSFRGPRGVWPWALRRAAPSCLNRGPPGSQGGAPLLNTHTQAPKHTHTCIHIHSTSTPARLRVHTHLAMHMHTHARTYVDSAHLYTRVHTPHASRVTAHTRKTGLQASVKEGEVGKGVGLDSRRVS